MARKPKSNKRDTDVPWPKAYVDERTVRHVRVDVQAFYRRDDAQQAKDTLHERAMKARGQSRLADDE